VTVKTTKHESVLRIIELLGKYGMYLDHCYMYIHMIHVAQESIFILQKLTQKLLQTAAVNHP
jgi:chromosome condensin MukBEF MukE localization factor